MSSHVNSDASVRGLRKAGCIMRKGSSRGTAVALAVLLLLFAPSKASTQEVGLVAPDAKEVAKGYRAKALELKTVVNDKGENIGQIDDFIFGHDDGPVFAILAVGDFVGLYGELVAVPFRNLKLN